jgi:hypothetical protein
MVVVLAGCGRNPWDAVLGLPVCDTMDTDPVCDDDASSSGTDGTGFMTTTRDDSSSTGSGSEGGSGTTEDVMGSTATTASTTSGDSTSTGEPVCGDGVVEGDEECEGGEACFECARDRWIFVTAADNHDGQFLDGIKGIDSLCRQYALQSGRADATWKTFIAWVSDSNTSMRDRLPAGIRGRYVRTDGTVVVERAQDLFSGSLLAPINVDEHNQLVIGGTVMTGTMPDGTSAPGTHCDNWTGSSLLDWSRYTGHSDRTDGWWTLASYEGNLTDCDHGERLYCLEGA